MPAHDTSSISDMFAYPLSTIYLIEVDSYVEHKLSPDKLVQGR